MEKSLTPIFIFAAAMLLTARAAPRWALRRPVLLAVLTAGFVAWALWVLAKLPVELMPNAASETVTVSISVRGGMSPADVETLIVRPLESVLGDIPRLKAMFSNAKKDRGSVTLDFHPGVDMKRVTAEVNERVDRVISKLPPEIEKPVIAHFEENDTPIFILAVTSPRLSPEEVRRLVDDRLKDRLLRAPGVANVEVGGGREGKILIELDRSRMLAYRLSPHQITSLIGRRNVAIQVGNVRGVTRVSPIRVGGQVRSLDDLRNVVVARDPSGGTVLLDNVATVTDGYLESESLSRLNGQAAVSVYIQKESSANTLKTSRAIQLALDSAWREGGLASEGLSRIVVSDQAQGIRAALVSVRVSLLAGVLLILLALCVFESREPTTKKAAVWLLAVLMGVMVVAGLMKKGDAFLEPYLLVLIGLFLLAAYYVPDIRAGLIVAGSMPLSALFCFLLFYACGITINVMSLFGLALGLGMLVDNATVVYENLSHRDLGPPGEPARARALAGTEEMVVPLIGATVTNAVVFVPFLFLSKEIQNMFTDVAAAVGASLFASLGISLTVVPLLTVMVPREGGGPSFPKRLSSSGPFLNQVLIGVQPLWTIPERWIKKVFSSFTRLKSKFRLPLWVQNHSFLPVEMVGFYLFSFVGFWWAGGKGAGKLFFFLVTAGATAVGLWALRDYRRWWPTLIRHRGVILVGVVVWALTAGLVLFKATERDFQMSGQADEFVIFVELTSGVKLDISNRVVADIEQVLASDLEVAPTIKTAVSRVEGWSSKVYVTLVPRAQRHLTTEQVQDLLREKLKHVGQDKDGNAFLHFSSPREGQEIAVQLLGPDYAVLEELAQKVSAVLGSIKGLTDVKMRYRPGRPEVVARVDAERAALHGLNPESVAETIHALMRGLRATVYRSGARQTETILRLKQEDRASLDALADLPIRTGQGRSVSLTEVANLTMAKMPNEVYRENKERFIQVTANRAGLSLGAAAEKIQGKLDGISFPLEYRAALEGGVKEMAHAMTQLTWGIGVMVLLVYLVLVILFESLAEPFVIMSTVPLCLIGVAAGLILFRIPLTTGVLVGIMMLAGVVVNNAIMLLDHFNGHTDKLASLEDRLVRSATARMRPIFLTAGSAILGFLPMMLDTSESGALWRPLAISMVFGLVTSTVLTLFVTPILTYVMQPKR